MVMYTCRSAAKEQSAPQHNPLQVSEEEFQESDSCTVMSGSVETKESDLAAIGFQGTNCLAGNV